MKSISRDAAIRAAAVLVAAAGAFYIAVWWRHDGAVPEGVEPGPAPQFSLKDYAGKEITQADFPGKSMLVYVWASWCPLCEEGLQGLAAIKKEFGDAVTVIAINRAEPRDVASRMSAAHGQATGMILLLDPDDGYYRAIGGFAMPETIFIDRDGMIRFHKRGPVGREDLRRRIEDMAHF